MVGWRFVPFVAAVFTVAAPAVMSAQGDRVESAALKRAIDQTTGLDADALVRLAFDRAPAIQIGDAQLAAAIGRQQQAALRSNPALFIERREQVGGDDTATTVGASWSAELGRLAPRRAVAAGQRATAEATRDESRRQLAAAVREAYGAVLAAARTISVAEAQMETARLAWRLADERAKTGAGAALDREQAAIEISLLTSRRARDDQRLETTRLALARVAGLGPTEPLAVRGTLETAAESVASVAAPYEDATPRSDIREAASEVVTAKARTETARASGRLDFSLSAQYMNMTMAFPLRGFSAAGDLQPIHGRFHSLSGGLNVVLPVFNRNQGSVAASQAEELAATHRLNEVQLAVAHEQATARVRLEQARLSLEAIRDEALPRSRANLDVVREAYSLGTRPVADVLGEMRRLQEVEMEYTAALLELYEAGVAVHVAAGRVDVK